MRLLGKIWHFHEFFSTSITIVFTVILCGSDSVCKQPVLKSSQLYDVITFLYLQCGLCQQAAGETHCLYFVMCIFAPRGEIRRYDGPTATA